MKIIYNNILPFKNFTAMAFFGVILARKEHMPLSSQTIRHENIHEAQAKECGGWVLFYVRYLWLWLKYGYKKHPMEREAYENEMYLNYLSNRIGFAWDNYKTK